jgi:GTP-binding protein
MEITQAEFVQGSTDYVNCPDTRKPEYAFIGRSNVGKSSLINMLTGRPGLAKTSQHPGKTQQINHFIVNDTWYLVDLPGYGYAKVSQKERAKWEKMIRDYLLKRENLHCVFVLIDSRHEAQKSDLDFMRWLAENGVPFSILFTKTDKQSKTRTQTLVEAYKARLLEEWEELPPYFLTSAETRDGRDEALSYISSLVDMYLASLPKTKSGKPIF